MPAGIRKSLFTGSSTIPAGSTFDFVTPNGDNIKIAVEDLLAALGVTGTLSQGGAITGTPLLDVQGLDNIIRNLEDGPGVKANVSPENGVTLSHTFLQGGGGSQVLEDPTSLTPTIRSIIAGAGIAVSTTNGSISVSLSGGAPPTTNIVIVNDVTDFPDPVGDVITGEVGFTYSLQGLIDISPNRLVLPASVEMFSENRLSRGLSSTNTGALVTVNDGGAVVLRELILMAPLGRYLDVNNGSVLVANNVLGLGSASPGLFEDTGNISFRNFSMIDVGTGTKGFLWSGTCAEFNASNSFNSGYTGTLYDFGTAVFTRGMTVGEGQRYIGAASSVVMSGLAAGANIGAGAIGLVSANKLQPDSDPTATFLSTITKKDAGWVFRDNQGVENSKTIGYMGQSGNATDTALTTSTFIQVGGTMSASDEIERCSVNGSEQLEFQNGQEECGTATAILDIRRVGSGTASYIFGIFKNGVQLLITSGVPAQTEIEVSATDIHVVFSAPACFKDGDVFDVRINRQSGSADILSVNNSLEVSG